MFEQGLKAEPRLKLDKLNIFGDGLNSNKPLKVREVIEYIPYSRTVTLIIPIYIYVYI